MKWERCRNPSGFLSHSGELVGIMEWYPGLLSPQALALGCLGTSRLQGAGEFEGGKSSQGCSKQAHFLQAFSLACVFEEGTTLSGCLVFPAQT